MPTHITFTIPTPNRRKGHCCPPQRHLERKYNLGSWVIVQRYRKDDLSVERKKRLDRIGFVWNWRDFVWERGFAALLKFKQREERRDAAEKEAASRRATDDQVLEDSERLIAAWNER